MTEMQEWGVLADQADLAVLAVHGRGQDPGFMKELSERFGPAPVRFHAPEAEGNTWYPHPFLRSTEENQPALNRSLGIIEDCVAVLADKGFERERVVLWGFSQGACLLAHSVLTTGPLTSGGIILFTGGYIGSQEITLPVGAPLTGVDVVMRSIDQDPWVPRHRVEDTARLLTRAGAIVDLRVDAGDEHIVTNEACEAATRLLTASKRPAR